jgi:uncharacterized protein with von Willebrand factor type A (vWA) domain
MVEDYTTGGYVAQPKLWNENAIETDAYDSIMWADIKEQSSLIEKMDKDGAALSDVYHSLYKVNPKVTDSAGATPKSIMDSMMGLPEYQNLRAMTRLDDVASALGTLKIGPYVMEQLAQAEKKEGEKASGKPGEPSEEGDGYATRRAMRQALKQAQEEAEEWEEVKAGWGIKPGELQRLPLGEKLKLADSLMHAHKLKAIADLAGRFRNMAMAAEATVTSHGMDEIVDITQGNDLARLLPSEFAKYKHARLQFLKDFVERKLMVYDLKGVEHLGAGPVIAMLDISGSMKGERDVWSKAVTLALISLAEKQKRPFAVLTFDTQKRDLMLFPKDKMPTLQDKIKIAEIATDGGGTAFHSPLMSAFDVPGLLSALKPADLIIITDGDAGLSEKQLVEINMAKLKTGMRIYGIGIGEARRDTLEKFCDNLSIVSSLGDVSHVKSLVQAVAMKGKVA